MTAGAPAAPLPRVSGAWHAAVPKGLAVHVILGALVIAAAVAGFGWWAVTAPLSSAAVAQGVFVATGQNKVIQHLEGGIVRTIAVREGDPVAPGQLLVELDATKARADANRLEISYFTLRTLLTRLDAERLGRTELAFPDDLRAAAAERPVLRELIDIQRAEFDAGLASVADETAILASRITAIEQEIEGLSALVDSQAGQIALVEQELADAQSLLDQGLIEKPRVLALQRTLVKLKGESASTVARIGEARQRIAETRREIAHLGSKARRDAVARYREVQAELDDVEERWTAARDVLDRQRIVAPVRGTVVKLHFHTPGAVISPGQPIVELLPTDEQLLIEAYVRPEDIDDVYQGLDAKVRLSSLNQRRVPIVDGKVIYVSADALKPADGDEVYYLARVTLDPEQLRASNVERLEAGMPAEVYIQTGERTFLDYIVQPITDSFQKAFREQ